MAIQVNGQTAATGAPGPPFPQDKQGNPLFTEANPRYYQNAYTGNVFIMATQAAFTFAAGLTSSTSTLAVANPAGSGKNAVLLQAEYFLTGTTAAVMGIVAQQYSLTLNTATTSGTITSGMIGALSPASVCRLVSSMAAAPVVVKILGGLATTNTAAQSTCVSVEIAGTIIIPPGCAAAIGASAANTGWQSLTWMELPI